MNKPKITIITITYNSEKTVRETFESVRAQHYDNLEYLIIDGGSKDSTLDIANEYSNIITRIISEPDEGISDAMNKGIKLATGDLIGIIHSDDMLAEGALNKLASCWDNETDIYYGDSLITSEDGVKTHILSAKEDLSGLPYSFCIVHPSSFVTKKCYDKHGAFDKSLKCCMDYDLMLRFYKGGAKFKYLNEVLAVYRQGGTNQKLRKQTIKECCQVSIKYGGNKLVAHFLAFKKVVVDKVRPLINKLGIHNSRVKNIN